MSLFDTLRYPISIPMTDEEFCNVPTTMLTVWSEEILKYNKKAGTLEKRMSKEDRARFLRKIILEWDE